MRVSARKGSPARIARQPEHAPISGGSKKEMMATEFPKGADEKGVPDAADRIKNMAEEDEEFEDDFGFDGYSLIMVPNELAPEISALIAKFYDEREAARTE